MIETIRDHVIPAAFELLPVRMRTNEAAALLLAIGLQESRFLNRRQVKGPARGFWQFERAGVAGVVDNALTLRPLEDALSILRYPRPTAVASLHVALEHNDILAAIIARLALWPVHAALPTREQPEDAWGQYVDIWRPGKPIRKTWDALYREAWDRQALAA